MDRTTQKPPWLQIVWHASPPRTVAQEGDEPVVGEWKEILNEEIESLKSQIQPYDKTELWDLAKRITNPFELINTFSNRLKLPVSTCCLHPLSRSFFKMIEILHHLQFFDRHKQPKLKTLHICEGPGGFIEAFYHNAEYKGRKIQSSHAMTLRSTHNMIPGWRRASQFLQKNTTVQLLYGPKKTGDIYDPENQQACLEAVGPTGAHFVTADGGFDFSEDFINQEKNILRLLVSSAIILLECVAHEGDIVLKVFDCNSRATRDFLYLLASCFQSWSLYKPVTSRPCNSEWYFLGKSAHRDRRSAIQLLKQVRDGLALEPPVQYTQLVENNPLDGLLQELQTQRCVKQKNALQEVLSFCKEHINISYEKLWQSQRQQTIQWCYAFRMPTVMKL
jgi:23S rRNA U2552 (ribose-2'-O)-methylase RlmE/FtsJ